MKLLRRISAFFWGSLRSPNTATGLVLAALVGVGTGLGAVLFRSLIKINGVGEMEVTTARRLGLLD